MEIDPMIIGVPKETFAADNTLMYYGDDKKIYLTLSPQ